MSTQNRIWSFIAALAIILFTTACLFGTATPQAPTLTPTPTGLSAFPATQLASNGNITATPGLATGGSIGGTGGNSNSGGSNNGTGSNNGSSNNGNSSSDAGITSTPTQLTEPSGGPYVVLQIESLGGEVISGEVCSLTKPFSVFSKTPKVAFTFAFVPQDERKGKVAYAYTIPSAGESHDATGTYVLSLAGKDGTLQLTLAVSDHVVFKGFDGNIPNNYKFNLVPSSKTHC
jgi:hypothetical protein